MPRHIDQKALLTRIIAILLSLILFNLFLVGLSKTNIVEKTSPFANGFGILTRENPQLADTTIYGFLPYWKLDDIKFLQLDKLTDISYFALAIEKNGKIKTRNVNGYIEPGYDKWKNSQELLQLIKHAKNFGIRMSVTVVSHEDATSDYFLSCRSCWDTLMAELIPELKEKGIKDVNLDFEYFEYVEKPQQENYTNFVKYVNMRLDKEFDDSRVVVSAFADSNIKSRITNIPAISKVADAIFIMAYDFHQVASDNAGPVAPISGAGSRYSYDLTTMLDDYLKSVPPSKLIMGVPYYGFNWVVESPTPFAKRITGDDYNGYSQTQAYSGVIDTVLEVNPEISWDPQAQSPYFWYISPETGYYRLAYYENSDSLRAKYKLAKKNRLGGVGIWALGYDGGYQELWDLLQEEFL